MTGEEALNLVRYYSGDHALVEYTPLNRALRSICQVTSWPWLRDVEALAFNFVADTNTYTFGDVGLRRIERVWTQDGDDGRKWPVSEADHLAFEAILRDNVDDDGNEDTDRPAYFMIERYNPLTIRITPVPDETYTGYLSGLVNTPVAQRSKDLPGPPEHHEKYALLAAAYHNESQGRAMLMQQNSLDGAQAGQVIIADAIRRQREVMDSVKLLVNDSIPNRMTSLQTKKVPLAR